MGGSGIAGFFIIGVFGALAFVFTWALYNLALSRSDSYYLSPLRYLGRKFIASLVGAIVGVVVGTVVAAMLGALDGMVPNSSVAATPRLQPAERSSTPPVTAVAPAEAPARQSVAPAAAPRDEAKLDSKASEVAPAAQGEEKAATPVSTPPVEVKEPVTPGYLNLPVADRTGS